MSNTTPSDEDVPLERPSVSRVPDEPGAVPDPVQILKSSDHRRKKHSLLILTFIIAFTATVLCPVLSAVMDRDAQVKQMIDSARLATYAGKSDAISQLRSFVTDEDFSSENAGGLDLNNQQDRELLFRVTGREAGVQGFEVPNPYQRSLIGSSIVGDKCKGLCMTSSKIAASMDSSSLSGAIDWTMIFRNRGGADAEARLELEIPDGATVSQATIWMKGQPKEAVFADHDAASAAYYAVVRRGLDPLLVTMPSKNHLMVQCFPVSATGTEMRIKIGMKTPLAVESSNCVLRLPRIVDSNFSEPKSHKVSVFSKEPFLASDRQECMVVRDGFTLFKKWKTKGNALPVSYSQALKARGESIAVQSLQSKGKNGFIVQSLAPKVTFHPARVYVVIDTSRLMKDQTEFIKSAIMSVPKSLDPLFCFVAESGSPQILSKDAALAELAHEKFEGGKDNGPALREILETASETPSSAVLWLHGPQPISQDLDRFLEFENPVKLYDFQVAIGSNQLISTLNQERLGNALELNRLNPKGTRNSKAALQELINNWSASSKPVEMVLSYSIADQIPKNSTFISDVDIAKQVTVLWAKNEVDKLLAENSQEKAESLARAYHIVTPVTAAVALEREEDYKNFSLSLPAATGSQLGSVNDTYRGIHQWFKDDLVGILFQNIGQLLGKWLSELIDGYMADSVQFLMKHVARTSLGGGSVTGWFGFWCVAQVLMMPAFLFINKKLGGDNKLVMKANFSNARAIGKFILLMTGYAVLCGLVIEFTASVCNVIIPRNADHVMMIDYALAQAVKGGVIAAGAGATTIFAPLIANLGIPVAGQFVGSLFYFTSTVLFTVLGTILVIELCVISAMLLSRQLLLYLQYLVAPVFVALDPSRFGRPLARILAELVAWTILLSGVMSFLAMFLFSNANPWIKVMLVDGVLFGVIWQTRKWVLGKWILPLQMKANQSVPQGETKG